MYDSMVRVVITLSLHVVFFILITIQAYSSLKKSDQDTSVAYGFTILATVLGLIVYSISVFFTHRKR